MYIILILVAVIATVLTTNYNELVENINNMKTTWKAEVPKNPEKYKSLLGTFRGRRNLKQKNVVVVDDLPENFEPVDKWPKCRAVFEEIRDQSVCGSCWAFGAVSAATDRICIHSNGTQTTRLSEEDLLTCCYSCGFGCSGGWPTEAWNYMSTTGIVTGGPYGDKTRCNAYAFPMCDHHIDGSHGPCGPTQKTPECVEECQPTYDVKYKEDKHYFDKPYHISSNEEEIKTELYKNGPVEVDFTVYEDFVTYKSGIYEHKKGGYLGGHAVKLVGWGVENGVKYWKIANSWNNEWGEGGYFRMIRGKNDCGIEEDIVGGIPQFN